MDSFCATVILVVILCALFILQKYLRMAACGFSKRNSITGSSAANAYQYQATLLMNGVMSREFCKQVSMGLESMGGIRVEIDALGNRIIVQMRRNIDDEMLRSVVEKIKPYTVLKITRTVY